MVTGKEAISDFNSAWKISAGLVVDDLNATVKRFWGIEEVPYVTLLTLEEEACYSHLKTTHIQLEGPKNMVNTFLNLVS